MVRVCIVCEKQTAVPRFGHLIRGCKIGTDGVFELICLLIRVELKEHSKIQRRLYGQGALAPQMVNMFTMREVAAYLYAEIEASSGCLVN
jgi:hypothetical protein